MAASSLACVVTTIGIVAISKYGQWANFAAGVLISVSFMHVIPKSFEMNGRAPHSCFWGSWAST
jgi:zinc transporter ZupT